MVSRRSGLLLLAAAVVQAVAPVVTFLGPGSSPAQGGGDELLVSPAGWAFAIWGAVYALAIAQAVGVLVARAPVPRRLLVDLLVLYLAAAAWIAVSAVGSSVGTAAVLLVMTLAALDAVVGLRRHPPAPAASARLSRVAVGLYAGWVTAALFVNLASAAVATGLASARAPGWQLAVLVAAALTVLAVLVASHGNAAYAAATVWAFAAIAATTASESATGLLVAALVAAVAVLVVAPLARRAARTDASTPGRAASATPAR